MARQAAAQHFISKCPQLENQCFCVSFNIKYFCHERVHGLGAAARAKIAAAAKARWAKVKALGNNTL